MVDSNKNIYFASDVHLGAPLIKDKREHEKRFVSWLDSIKDTCKELYLLGDIFDFWYEYKYVAPRGFIRFLGKIAEFTDAGIPVYFFTGNHDMWIFDYLPTELGVTVYHTPQVKYFDGKKFYLAHGDGLSPFDAKYNALKKIFTNKFIQKCFSFLVHPNLVVGFARKWSVQSRGKNKKEHDKGYLGADKEWLMIYAKDELKKEHYDYFIFGHRHLQLDEKIADNTQFIYLGDWIQYFSYGVWDGTKFQLLNYK